MCRGFFAHWEHLTKHFTWLTNVESLVEEVEQNLYKQIGKFLKGGFLVNISWGIVSIMGKKSSPKKLAGILKHHIRSTIILLFLLLMSLERS